MTTLIEHPDNEKESTGADPMIKYLIEATLNSFHIKSKDTKHNITQVTDTGVGHQFLHIGLHQSHQGTINYTNHSKNRYHRRKLMAGIRKQRNRKAHKSVGSHLQENTSQDHTTGSRGLNMSIRQPGV